MSATRGLVPIMADPDDVMKTARKLFSKLGDKMRGAGSQIKQTAKQVTGIGRGDVKLELVQTRVAPGGTVRGRVVLALTEPTEAKRLVVTLQARQKVVTIGKTDSGGRSVGSSHADVFAFD